LNMEYQLNQDFLYSVDIFDIKLINAKKHVQLTLKYPDAAVFALIVHGYSFDTMVRMMTSIAHVTQSHAEDLIKDTVIMLRENHVLES
jgi:hypothetical protein